MNTTGPDWLVWCMSLLSELKRRNVIRVAVGYVVAAWLVVQVVETIFPAFGFGDEAVRFVVIAFAVGLIPVIVLAWVFEWTPQGIRKDEGEDLQRPVAAAAAKRWDRIVMVVLALAVAFFIVENILERPVAVEPAVLVVPFENMSSDPEQAYFSVGISESVHGLLARIPALTVSAWRTAVELSAQGMTTGDIAKTLKAPNLLEGTVQTSGNRVRVTARLVALASNATLWSQTYDRTLDDIFAIQDEIAADVVSNLRVQLLGDVPRSQRTNLETRRLTAQAWALLHAQIGPEDETGSARAAIELLDKALALDPEYIDAMMAKSFAGYALMLSGLLTKEEEQQQWQEIKARALAVDPEHGLLNAYLILESLDWISPLGTRDFELANAQLQVALRHGLNDPEALRMLEGLARRTGNIEAALEIGRRSQAVDPTCTRCLWQYTESLFYAHRYEETIEAKRRLQLMSLGAGGYYNYALSILRLGDFEAAMEYMRSQTEMVGQAQSASIQAMAAWSLGDLQTFEDKVSQLKQAGRPSEIALVAEVYAWVGDADQAFEWLDKAIDAGDYVHLNLFHPSWDNLRNDPRWETLRERLNWSAEQLAVLDFSALVIRD